MSYFEVKNNQFLIDEKLYSPGEIITHLQDQLTEQRIEKIETTVKERTQHIVPLMENIYDQGNVHAVMRSAESFGFYKMGLMASVRTKQSSRVTSGAHKWLDVSKFKDSASMIRHYQKNGYQVAVTSLSAKSIDFKEIDYTKPTCLLFGNEKDGASEEAKELGDIECIIPTVGLTQSFNISVAAAIMLSWVFHHLRDQKISYHLTQDEQDFLKAHYYLRNIQHAQKIMKILKRIY